MMQTQIINGRKIRDEILLDVKSEVEQLSFQPVFCDVLVGDDVVSSQYVNMKKKAATNLGILFHDAHFSESISQEELIEEIKKINQIQNICGVIVQLPLPEKFSKDLVVNTIAPHLDVDCLGDGARIAFYENMNDTGYPAALSCVHILDSLNLDLNNKKIVIVGQGELVGKPVAHILSRRGFDITTITKSTEDKDSIIKSADILISAAGVGKFIDGSMVKEGVVIIDAGTSESDGGIVGDVDTDSVSGVASFISPVPGGVGPVTIAILLNNVLLIAKK
ncbi:MAG: bifunctional 5,10-methylenetetrahydrofolate dehydrogenase/5,10-methenyltetrahydrofolate cyclohydrolase [Candidatus Nomurabacteria bacterium]|nr:bifunctional 5,10-methylenetetrahydrofolate dehydrogenase/5,10-methenyltetrahydrofolate cyclohydrolase [Candidatus Nomurabacteria bacterium]